MLRKANLGSFLLTFDSSNLTVFYAVSYFVPDIRSQLTEFTWCIITEYPFPHEAIGPRKYSRTAQRRLTARAFPLFAAAREDVTRTPDKH